jgi:biotin carboxyl carrier protein
MNTKAVNIETNGGFRLHMKPGDVISKEKFVEIIEQMKMASKRLHNIKASINEEIKSVKI